MKLRRTTLVFGGAVVVLTLHAAACVVALALLPHGTEPGSLLTWSDTFIPGGGAAALTSILVAFVFFRSSPRPVGLSIAAAAGAWLGAAVTGLVLFPVSMPAPRCVGPAAIALALATLAWAARSRRYPWASLVAAVGGAAIGVVEIAAQRAPPPATRPSGGTLATVTGEPTKDDAATGQVSFPCGKEHVRVRPLLTFERRSPDATWPLLAPPEAIGWNRRFDAFAKEKTGFRAHYMDDGESTLTATKDAKGLDIEAISKLPQAVYSDKNAFTTIHVPFAAWVSLSPLGRERFVLDPGHTLEGHLGSDLDLRFGAAKGHLGRDEALVVEIGHRDEAIKATCRLTLRDWAAQLSTEHEANVIELSARRNGNEAETTLVLSLARPADDGWPIAAGHTEGTYRNRIRVDTVM